MELVVITEERILPSEPELLNRLFRAGVPALHLRKPGASETEIRSIIEGLEPGFRSRVVLHDYFELVPEYELKGVHLNSRNPKRLDFPVGHVSRSCHSIAEVEALDGDAYDYVFLSPIFDSISKEGYSKGFTEKDLLSAKENSVLNKKVYALGGVDENTMPAAARLGFGGVAILGALWKDFLKGAQAPEQKLRALLAKAREL